MNPFNTFKSYSFELRLIAALSTSLGVAWCGVSDSRSLFISPWDISI
jgi:hypothetical protein